MGQRKLEKVLISLGILTFMTHQVVMAFPLQLLHKNRICIDKSQYFLTSKTCVSSIQLPFIGKSMESDRSNGGLFKLSRHPLLSTLKSSSVNLSRPTKPTLAVKMISLCVLLVSFLSTRKVLASVGLPTGPPSHLPQHPVRNLMTWAVLFSISAVMHSAESAITKISPWKVQQFAEEEGPNSPFGTLNKNITRMLITILLSTTACSIYSTALFVTSMSALFPRLSLGFITAALTVITLFFGELLPKALAVSNSELVARKLVPILARMTSVLTPFTASVTVLSDLVLRLTGMRNEEDKSVSEDMLRMVVEEAQKSEGIETGEGRMIKNVLDMQDKEVEKIMTPRVDIVGVGEDMGASEILRLATLTKYSRLPVYRGDVDNIVGVVFSKDLLDFMTVPATSPTIKTPAETQADAVRPVPLFSSITAKDLMEPCFFIPETMTCYTALQEMRKRHLHMAVVVDEYGGTSGLITFEDILEEVVGEIYDEDDSQEVSDDWTIFRNPDDTFLMKGAAELDDVYEALGLQEGREGEGEECSTLGGLLCGLAGRIPGEGEVLLHKGYRFVVVKVQDKRRLVDIYVSRAEERDGSNGSSSGSSGGSDGLERGESRRESGEEGGDSGEDFSYSAEEQQAVGSAGLSSDGGSEEKLASTGEEGAEKSYLIFQDGMWIDPKSI